MTNRRRATVLLGAVVLLITVWIIPYTGTYLAASNASRAAVRSTQNGAQLRAIQEDQAGIQKLLDGMNTLLSFVASSQSRTGRASSIFFARQMQNICKATPGCRIEPLPPGLRP